MTYVEGEELISKNQRLLGSPLIDREGIESKDSHINLMLIASSQTLGDVFDNWITNGKNNKLAIENLQQKAIFFDVFVCHYNEKGLMAYSTLEVQLHRMKNPDKEY